MDEAKVWRRNPNMVKRVIGDEIILLPIYKSSKEMNCIYTLNKAASRVWEMLDGKRGVFEIKRQLAREFEGTADEIDRELHKILKEFQQIEAIKEVANAN